MSAMEENLGNVTIAPEVLVQLVRLTTLATPGVARFAPNPEARRIVRRELGIPDAAWVVCTVGRLAPEKDQAALVDAMAPLLDARRHLVIVGDGPEHEALRARRESRAKSPRFPCTSRRRGKCTK